MRTLQVDGVGSASVVLNYEEMKQSIFVGCIPVASWSPGAAATAYRLRCVPIGRPVAPGQFASSRLPIWYPGTFRTSNQFTTHRAVALGLVEIFRNHIEVLKAPSETQLLNLEAFGEAFTANTGSNSSRGGPVMIAPFPSVSSISDTLFLST